MNERKVRRDETRRFYMAYHVASMESSIHARHEPADCLLVRYQKLPRLGYPKHSVFSRRDLLTFSLPKIQRNAWSVESSCPISSIGFTWSMIKNERCMKYLRTLGYSETISTSNAGSFTRSLEL